MLIKFLQYLKLRGVSSASLKYYKSDITNFINWAGEREITAKLIREYIKVQTFTSPKTTINRRLSTLRSYSQFLGRNFMLGVNNVTDVKSVQAPEIKVPKTSTYRFLQEKILARFEKKPRVQNAFFKLFFARPNWYKAYHSYPLASYIHIAILVLFTSITGYAIYDQVFNPQSNLLAFPTALTRPNRYLSFQGRLTSNVGNPITTATNLVFKLYAASSGGSALWDSGTCSITPDQDGIFSTLLGSSCGAEIASTVFSENAAIWLGVTVGVDAEATPRVQIATVAYALNSETLQGFPAGTGTSTIPYINSTGALVLANASPTIQSTSGTFAVEGLAMTITTPNASNGVITVNPDGVGTLDLTFEGAAAGLSANGFVNATNANITSGALYGGTVASAATGYNFIDFQGGVSPASKFSVSAVGDVTLAGDLTVSGSSATLPNNSISPNEIFTTGQTDEYCLTYEETGTTWEWQSCAAAGGGSWSALTVPTANLSLAHAGYTTAFTFNSVTTADAFALSSSSLTTGTILDLASTSTAGGASGLSKVLDITRSGTNANASHTAYGLYSAVTNTGTTSTNVGGYFSASGATNNYAAIFDAGNVGIGTTGPTNKLHIDGTTAQIRFRDSVRGVNWDIGPQTAVNTFEFKNDAGSVLNYAFTNGNVGIGTTGPTAKLHIVGGADTQQLIVKANATQTTNLQEWQNSSGTVLAGVTPLGNILAYGKGSITTNFAGGYLALNSNTTGSSNSAIGSQALRYNTTGYQNTAMGDNALLNNIAGFSNIALGAYALTNNTGSENMAIGLYASGGNTTGGNNASIGVYSLLRNQTGSANVAIGYNSGKGVLNNSFSNNTLIGAYTGLSLSTGSSNIFIGKDAGYRQTTNSNLLIIDNQSRADVATELTNSIIYGVMAATPASQSLRINADTLISGNVGIGTTSPTSKLHVEGAVTGKALAIFNETGDQNILTASQSGIPVFNLARVAGTAANGTTFTPSATGNAVTQAATGSDTNIAYSLDAKGSGALNLNGTATGDVNLAGGYGGTGCTVTNSNGNLSCNGTITGTIAGTIPWSEIDVPTANLSLAHAGYTTAFTFDSVTTADAFALSSSSLTTGTILDLSSTSTAGGASGLSKVLDIGRSGTNSNASHTAYGLYSAVTNTGTTSTNVGGYFSASGATNNYGLIVGAGNVGIGTTGPSAKLVSNVNAVGTVTGLILNNQYGYGVGAGTAATRLAFGRDNSGTGQTIIGGAIDSGNEDETTSNPQYMAFSTKSGTTPFNLTERVRITSTGNVGIGTTAPGAKLEIGYPGLSTVPFKINAISSGYYAQYTIPGDGSIEYDFVSAGGNSDMFEISQTNAAFANRVFEINNEGAGLGLVVNDSANDTTPFVVDASGNVGIGTTGPTEKLSLLGVNPLIKLQQNGGTSSLGIYFAGITSSYIVQSSGTNSIVAGSIDGDLVYRTASKNQIWTVNGGTSAAMYLNSSGNVGIGTTGPATALSFGSSSSEISIATSDASDTGSLNLVGAGGSSSTRGALVALRGNEFATYGGELLLQAGNVANTGIIAFNTGGVVERMRITNTGNVGIGTTSPGSKLDVVGTTGDVFRVTNSVGTYTLNAYTWTTPSSHAIQTGGYLALRTGYTGAGITLSDGADEMTIKSGNVGIGTTGPSSLLHVSGAASPQISISDSNAGTEAVNFGIRSDTGTLSLRSVNDAFSASWPAMDIVKTSGGFSVDHISLYTGTSGTERVRITTDGNVGIGTTAPGAKLDVVGGAIRTDSNGYTSNNVSGTGTAAYFPGGIYAIGTNSWLYSTTNIFSGTLVDNTSGVWQIKAGGPTFFNATGGNVGIGTTGPTNKLHIDGTTAQIRFRDSVRGVNWDIGPQTAVNTFEFKNDAGSVLNYAFTNGNVGIGTTSPLQKLHVVGSCVTGDTLLPIRRRRRRKSNGLEFDDEFDDEWDYLLCRIDEILPGDEVLSLNEFTGAMEYARINALKDMDIKEVYELTTKSGKVIRTTENHPYLTLTEDNPIENEEKLNI